MQDILSTVIDQAHNIASVASHVASSIDLGMSIAAEPEPEPSTCEIYKCTW